MSSWKNYFIYIAVGVLKLFQTRGDKNNFLIVSTTGLGDSLWATPAIRALRLSYPQAYIGCLTSSMGSEVFKNNPYLDELFIFNKTPSLLKMYFQLRKRKIGTALLFHTSQRIILPLCSAIGTQERIGTAGLQKGLDGLLTKALCWTSGHEIERRMDIVKAVHATAACYELDFIIDDTDRTRAKALIPAGYIVGLHPGAKDRFKQWPAEHFIQLGKQLKQALGCTIVVTGSLLEKDLVEKICLGIGEAKPIIQSLNIMAALLEKLSLFITNDTGALHLALAMKTPTIALFGPTDPQVCGPFQAPHATVIQVPPTCTPCLKKKCRHPFCMRQIGPDAVVRASIEHKGS